jgi:hypothetical protein
MIGTTPFGQVWDEDLQEPTLADLFGSDDEDLPMSPWDD